MRPTRASRICLGKAWRRNRESSGAVVRMDILTSIKDAVTADPKATIALASPFVTVALNRLFTPSVKLFHSVTHGFHYLINEPLKDKDGNEIRPSQSVAVQSISISNAGRVPAKNLEIVFNWKPNYINVWPVRRFQEHIHPDGRYSVHLENLAPKEVFGLELLSVNAEMPNIVTARSEEAESRERNMTSSVELAPWAKGMVLLLMTLGLITLVYVILTIFAFAVS